MAALKRLRRMAALQPSGAADQDEVVLAVDDFEDRGGPLLAGLGLDLDEASRQVGRQGRGRGMTSPPGAVRQLPGHPVRERRGGSRSSWSSRRWCRSIRAVRGDAGNVFWDVGQGDAHQPPDPGADVDVMVIPESIQGAFQVGVEADAEGLHEPDFTLRPL